MIGDEMRQRGIGGEGAIGLQWNGKPSCVCMAASAERGGNRADICPVFARTHAEITTSIAIMPDEAEWMVRRQPFANLACQDGALHRRDDQASKFDHHGLCSEFADQFAFVTQYGPAFLFQGPLRETVPKVEVKRIRGQSSANLAASG